MGKVQFIKNGRWSEERPTWSPIAEILIQHSASENHYHTGHEYYIVCQGSADIILENQRFQLRPGEVAAIHSGVRHHIENDSPDFTYVALREDPASDRIYDPSIRKFIGFQGRYEDGPVTYDEVPEDRCAVVQARTWFWLKQKPSWSFITSMGFINFPDGTDEPDYHKHEMSEIYICVSGHMTALAGDEYYDMHEGDIVTIPTGTYHRIYKAHGDSQLAYFYGAPEGLRRYGHLEDGRDSWVL